METTHRFLSSYFPKPEKYCDMTVSIEEKYYPLSKKGDKFGDFYYIIKYLFSYGPHKDSQKCHPFFGEFEFKRDYSVGDIFVKNKISEALVEYLLMDINELQYHCGTKPVDVYIKQIMKQLMISMD